MKKLLQNEDGFTLIEMMIVLLVISVLLFITIPNVTKESNSINTKGCEAFKHMVEGQVEAFRMDNNRLPTGVSELAKEGYLQSKYQNCPDGTLITIEEDGSVTTGATSS